MITYIPQEEILINWPALSRALGKFWDVGINLETLDNLKRKLLAEDYQLWMWSDPEVGRYLFVSDSQRTPTAMVFCITHTAGFNESGEVWGIRKLRRLISRIFSDIEDLAFKLGHDAVKIHARPAHVRLAEGYEEMSTPIIKMLSI